MVDLGDPANGPQAIHPGFDARVFTVEERAYLAAARCAHRARWSLWAAKEAAFKAARKLDAGAWLSPRAFVVRMTDGWRAEVEHRTERFRVWLHHADEWVHAVAVPWGADEAPPPAQVTTVEAEPHDRSGRRPGRVARELARSALSRHLGVGPSRVEIVTEDRIPRVHVQGGHGDEADLSLSHDGRFAACAWLSGRPRR